jgi:alkanesulfonate monooxygenase SsuD/methylene tetrahydromethanopterin reductase-like flavin-dependent oxidoreductase (luciferase family)
LNALAAWTSDPILRIADLSRFAQIAVDLARVSESRNDCEDGGSRIEYQYRAAASDRVLIHTVLTVDTDVEQAQFIFQQYIEDVPGLGDDLAIERDDRLSWGDSSATWSISDDGEQIGHAIAARKGVRTLFVIFTGVPFKERDAFLELVQPKLDALDKWMRTP